MNWKFNAIENLVLIVVMFVCLGVYTSIILKPILLVAIQTETSKIETNIKTDIDNKFKKIDNLTSTLGVENPSDNNLTNNNDCYISTSKFNSLSSSDKKKIKRILK